MDIKNSPERSNDKTSPLFAKGLATGLSVLDENPKVRLAFLRKVYGILSAQLGLTLIISALIMLSPMIQEFFFAK
jgi:FtsH-binding integral membrane protein